MNRAGSRQAIVVGGGVAGIAAAFGLLDRGFAVTLLEAHGWLGGRAFSFADRGGRRLDNGPHVMLGCYRALRALLRRLRSDGGFQVGRSLALSWRTAGGQLARLSLARLPVPLAMPAALLRLPMRGAARLRALRGFAEVLRGAPAAWTVADWVLRRGQAGAPAAFLWDPLCRAIMNVEPAAASARLLLRTLREAFGGSAAAGAFWIPRRPWGELVGDAALAGLRGAGADVRLHARLTGFATRAGAITELALGDGTSIAVGPQAIVASAVPHHALAKLCAGVPPLRCSPLVSVHFEVDEGHAAPPDDGPLAALVDGEPFHFLYRTPGAAAARFTLIAGGSIGLDGRGVDEIERIARAQVARYCGWDPATPAHVRVVKEARATFVAGPAVDRPRPGRLPGGPRNLFVCGDWTDTGLPATLEGAARSAAAMLRAIEGA